MKEKTSFWSDGIYYFLVFEMIKSTVVQNDLFACIKVPIRVWCRYVEWVIRPSELNNFWGRRNIFQQNGRGVCELWQLLSLLEL